MIVYLHGFRSSPQSFKAQVMAQRMRERGLSAQYLCPQLPASPRVAMETLSGLLKSVPVEGLSLIGSSLGGFYATWLAEQTGCAAVLLNPAVTPARDLARHVGIMPAWHSDEPFEFKAEYVDELDKFSVESITRPARYFLVAATGDEVLDWRQMVAHYPGARQKIIEGSDHGLSDFPNYVDEVLSFCDVNL